MSNIRMWKFGPTQPLIELSATGRSGSRTLFNDELVADESQGGLVRLYKRASNGAIEELLPVDSLDLEQDLEEAIVTDPSLLEPELLLVARQLPTAGGPPDLLGVDTNGCLVIVELKRGALDRHSVTQVLDYASALQELTTLDLQEDVASRSGENGIPHIQNFGRWLSERGRRPDRLLPARMMLVGIGIDKTAMRIVRFLRAYGVQIELTTFFCFLDDNATFLVRPADELVAATPHKPPPERAATTSRTKVPEPAPRLNPDTVAARAPTRKKSQRPKDAKPSAFRREKSDLFAAMESLLEECFAGTPRTTKPQKYGVRFDLKGLVVDGKRQRQFLTGVFVEDTSPGDVFLCIFETAYSGWNPQYNEMKQALKTHGIEATWWKKNDPGMRTRAFRFSSADDLVAAREHVLKFFQAVTICLPE